jgi:hypothetical protein
MSDETLDLLEGVNRRATPYRRRTDFVVDWQVIDDTDDERCRRCTDEGSERDDAPATAGASSD